MIADLALRTAISVLAICVPSIRLKRHHRAAVIDHRAQAHGPVVLPCLGFCRRQDLLWLSKAQSLLVEHLRRSLTGKRRLTANAAAARPVKRVFM